MKQFKWWILDNWQSLVLFIGFVALASFALLFQLGALTGGLSESEATYATSTAGIGQILNEPAFLPHKMLSFLAQSVSKSVAFVRLPSVLIALVSVVVSITYLRRRYSLRTVVLGGLLITSSSWLISIGRLALPEISLILWAPLFGLWEWLKQTTRAKTALLVLVIASSLALYIPGFIWLLIGLLVLERKAVFNILSIPPVWMRPIAALLAVLVLAPMIRASILDPQQLLLLAGLPTSLSSLTSLPSNMLQTLSELFLISHKGAIYTVGRLPLLDIFSVVLLFLGAYAQRYSPRKWQIILAASFLLAIIFVSFNGPVSMVILFPLIFGLIAAGIGFLLTQWFTVFPYNPIARSIGTTLMIIGVMAIAFYHINRYFIAWPQVPETRQQFNHSLLK